LAQATYTFPIYNYTHSSGGCSITGGYVYRGNLYNDVFGRYFYTDYCDGVIRGIIPNGNGGYTNQSHGTFTQFQYTTLGEDQFGEVYIAQQNGVIARLTIAASLPRAVIIASGPLTVCFGDGLELSTGLNPLLSYSWAKDGIALSGAASATLLPTQSGSYTVTATNSAGSSTSEAVQVTINPLPGVSIAGINDAYCLNSPEVALTLEPAGGELNGLGTNNANGTFSPELAGTGQVNISYTVTDGNGCSNTASFDVIIDSCVGIEGNKKQDLAISPNPFGDWITISNVDQVKGTLKIVNALGQTVLSSILNGTTQTIGTQALPKGSYFVVIQNTTGQTVRKLIKN
jgi:hypothetical protein